MLTGIPPGECTSCFLTDFQGSILAHTAFVNRAEKGKREAQEGGAERR